MAGTLKGQSVAMTSFAFILVAIGLILALFLAARSLGPKYTVVNRLGSIQLTNKLNSIRISTVMIKRSRKNSPHEKGLFVYGATRGGVHASEYEEVFPITEREIDELIMLLKSQQVFSVNWKKRSSIQLTIDGSAQIVRLIIKKFTWMDYSFVARLGDRDIAQLLGIFELLKNEADIS